jgi:hypothetical protein
VIDLSNLRAPGWNRIVAELSQPATDDRAYLDRLLRIIAQVSASKQACLILPQAGQAGELLPRILAVCSGPPSGKPDAPPTVAAPEAVAVEHEKEVKQVAIACLESAQSRAFGLDGQNAVYDGQSSQGYLLAVPVPDAAGRAIAAVTLLIDARSRQAVQSTLAMAEVLAGYVHGHVARSELRRQQASVMALELATRLLSATNTQDSFKGASLQLVNDLTRQLGADRAALGWVKGSAIHLVALSDAEHFNPRTEMVKALQNAMDECLDQEQAVVFPPPEAAQDVLLAHAITTAHRRLVAGNPGLVACSVPLRKGDKTVGVITVELRAPPPAPGTAPKAPIDTRGVEVLQAAADLLGPVLAVRKNDDRILPLRTLDASRNAGAWFVGSKHTPWKLAGILLIAAFIFCALFRIEHRVGSMATLEARSKRVVAAPFDAVVASLAAGIQPGSTVRAGDLLVELDTRELKLQLASTAAKRDQGERQLANARKEGKVGDAQLAQAAIDKARADEQLIQRRLELSRITSPIDGVIIAGDLKDKLGAAVKVGDGLMQIAPVGDLYVQAKVDERDVGLIHPGGSGRVHTRARPQEGFDVTIDTIVPLAVATEGRNEFEVRATIQTPEPWMRPGMEGVARLDAGQRTLLWIGTRRIIDTVRLWVW